MRNLIMAGLMATSLLPAAAQAQYGSAWVDPREAHELHRDRDDIRDERRDLNYAYRFGDRHDIERERRDYWNARREYHEDWRDAHRDWRAPYGGYGARWIYRGDRALLIDRWGRVIRVVPRYWR